MTVRTKEELRQTEDYKKAVAKIEAYRKGFEFTIPYYKMTKPQKRAMYIILEDCVKAGLIESREFSLNLTGDITEEKFVRL